MAKGVGSNEGGRYSDDPSKELSIRGVEMTDETGLLCRLNLAFHSLEGEIKHGGDINSYYDDPHDATGRFDFVLVNGSMSCNQSGEGKLRPALIEADLVGCRRSH